MIVIRFELCIIIHNYIFIDVNHSILFLLYCSGPFRATQIWNEVIDHLKEKVELKKRRYKLRNYDNCFTGTDAVDVAQWSQNCYGYVQMLTLLLLPRCTCVGSESYNETILEISLGSQNDKSVRCESLMSKI